MKIRRENRLATRKRVVTAQHLSRERLIYPKRYNRRLRRVFYMAALSSIRADGPSRAFYDRKRDERLIHTQALLALARRLVDVLWALLRDNRLFTPTAPTQITSAA